MRDNDFKVTLIPGSYSDDPIKAIWFMWEQSRCDDDLDKMHHRYNVLAKLGYRADATPEEKAQSEIKILTALGYKPPVDSMLPSHRFRLLLEMDVPLLETIKYTFLLENIPVSFREQLVRHRVGSKIGPNSGVDDEPGIPEVTYWSQTSRVRDLQNFVEKENYFTPDISASEDSRKPVQVTEDAAIWTTDPNTLFTDKEIFVAGMKAAQWSYRELRARGYAPEIAREVLPSCTNHRITWTVNIKSLKHILGHRTCWIAFAGYWHPIIRGVIREMTTKVSPSFFSLANPPCIDKRSSKFKSCIFEHENLHRMPGGNDPGIPCSLWLSNDATVPPRHRLNVWVDQAKGTPDLNKMLDMMDEYSAFWGRDPQSGDLLK